MQSRIINKKALRLLTDDEKASLALQQINGKSTWQAGEIMKKSHYKYLEINQRAKKYLELFQTHYNKYQALIPEKLIDRVDPDMANYLSLTIEKRLTVKKAAEAIGGIFSIKKTREEYISKFINGLRSSAIADSHELYRVIMEFDRYNNFRILPNDVQEPSAFKRRNKTRFKKHLLTSLTLDSYVRDMLVRRFKAKRTDKSTGYIVLCHNTVGDKLPEIVKVRTSEESIRLLSSISIYIFKDEQTSLMYRGLVADYLNLVTNSPREGLKFWPKYRALIKEAINFSQMNNIAPSRKNLLTSLKMMDIKSHQQLAMDKLDSNLQSGF